MMLPASLVTPLEDNGKTPKRYTIQISLDESPVIVIYRIHDYERTVTFLNNSIIIPTRKLPRAT